MRSFYFILLVFPLLSFSQECKLLKETDPYTKETKLSSGFIEMQQASVNIIADDKEIDFFFIVNDRCFNDASTVFVYFEGSKVKTTYRNSGSVNCDGYFHFKFRNSATTQSPVQKMATQKIAQFVFTDNTKKQVIVSLLPDQQAVLMKTITCIASEAKSLIK